MARITASINYASVEKKLKDWERSAAGEKAMDNKIAEYIISGKETTDAGGKVTTLRKVRELAEDLKSVIVSLSGDAPDSVVVNVQSLSEGDAMLLDNNKIELGMDFTGDLSRPSLDPARYPEGARNIIVLFDKGYSAGGAVFGEWHGEMTVSLRTRYGIGFLQRAISTFNSLYGLEWGVVASLHGVYE